ncbi:MAG TPA: hypothetical protein VM536_05670 [Chloroflexia bacterium]|nr:hypothetical protein [Chloroflexia bacterium]
MKARTTTAAAKTKERPATEADDVAQLIARLTTGIEAAPEDATLYGQRAETYYAQGAYDHALADATRAVELASDVGVHYLHRGRIFAAMGLRSAARQDFQRGASLGDALAQKELRTL